MKLEKDSIGNPVESFIIQVINKNRQRGFVIDRPSGIQIVIDALHRDVTQFYSLDDAKAFIKQHKLDNNGNRAYVRTFEECLQMISSGQVTAEQLGLKSDADLFYIERQDGAKLCYDAKNEQYFFKNVARGFCVYKDDNNLKEMEKLLIEQNFKFKRKPVSELPK